MANYIVQDTSLGTVADAIRAKAGISEKLVFPDGWKAAVENISVGSAPDGSTVSFGYETRTETTQAPTGKAWFNGVLLPKIPEDVLAQYPYAWIREDTTTNNYDLALSKGVWYLDSSGSPVRNASGVSSKWYKLPFADADAATEWPFVSDETDAYFSVINGRYVVWTSHNILKGSATATGIYFKGSESVTEIKTTTSVPVEREEQYAIASEDLNELGAVTQKMAGKHALMTVADMVYWLKRVQFVPQGYAESAFALNFTAAAASGILPDVQRGTAATSAFALNFTSSATGALQEE